MEKERKRRERSDIVGEYLNAAKGGWTQKTKLMYEAGVSFAQHKAYLKALVETGFLEERENPANRNRSEYKTTESGLELLDSLGKSLSGMKKINEFFLKNPFTTQSGKQIRKTYFL